MFIKLPTISKEPLSEEELAEYNVGDKLLSDKNVVEIPELRYQYFVVLFKLLKSQFVYDEDYGFKSFLSMRIRHGTFSNVLRMVFEKHQLISSRESNSDRYRDIPHWLGKVSNSEKSRDLQSLLHEFSLQIDTNIDRGLSWLVIRNENIQNQNGYFDFEFGDEELFNIYRNRIGRITEFKEFCEEIFLVFFERLEKRLTLIRYQISSNLTVAFVSLIDELQDRANLLKLKSNELSTLAIAINNCRTEIQATTAQIENWFRISKNRYIEEFPIQLILDTIKNYINSIYADALSMAKVTSSIDYMPNINGKYFEKFGDLFINLFDNIVRKNKDLKQNLEIGVRISVNDGELNIYVSNNLAEGTDISELLENIEIAKDKINNYKNGTDVSYEEGSGFVKLCKSIAVDLGRQYYSIVPAYHNGRFEVSIVFETKNLFV
jgi:hypothetical protein